MGLTLSGTHCDLVSDRDSGFESDSWRDLCEESVRVICEGKLKRLLSAGDKLRQENSQPLAIASLLARQIAYADV